MFKPKKGRYFQDYSRMNLYMQKKQKIYRLVFYSLLLVFIVSCAHSNEQNQTMIETESITIQIKDSLPPPPGKLESELIAAGLVNIADIIPGILVELRYSTTNNFLRKDMYGDLINAYLQTDVADKLKKAEKLLQLKDSTLTLLVYDCVRPLHIQQLMWDSLDVPLAEKKNFLSNPTNKSLHNYGAAVDLTIATIQGVPLDMGTPYDFIGQLAYPTLEEQMLKEGRLTADQIANRKLLRSVMFQSGFTGIESEWWHFNSCTREEANMRYKVIE